MTPAKCEELHNETLLVLSIRRLAWKYFGRTEAARDAESEAWEHVLEAPDDLEHIDYLNVARRSISAAYMRSWRRRKLLLSRKE